MPEELPTTESIETTQTTETDVVDNTTLPADVVEPEKISDEEKPSAENKESFISKMKEKIFGKKEDTKEVVQPEFEEDISDKFTEAAIKIGWTEDQIIEFASKYSNKELEELIPQLQAETKLEDEPTEEPKEKTVTETLELDDEKLRPYLEKIEKAIEAKYQEKIGKIENSLKTAEQDRSAKEARQYQITADEFFDAASKDFPVFGKTSELPRFPKGTANAGKIVPKGEAFEARNAVWQVAVKLHQAGSNWNDALSDALAWYKGKNMEKDVRSKVIRDLKKQEMRLSPKRSEHTMETKYATEEEKRRALIDNIARRAGIS
jgi:hypothetical protein